MALSLGKLRGLQSAASGQGIFSILALDHGRSFVDLLRSAPHEAPYSAVSAAKLDLVRALAPHASAVLLDAEYGVGPALTSGALAGHGGLLVAVEDGDYATPTDSGRARLLRHWSVAKIKRLGATGVKLFFYYNPRDAKRARDQEAFVAQVVRDCARHDIALFAEPITYGTGPGDKREAVVTAAERIGGLGVDVLKLEFPIAAAAGAEEDQWAEACAEITAKAPVPWILLSAGVDFELFARQVEVACRAGASGYMAGRAVWREAATLDASQRAAAIQKLCIPRLNALAVIAAKHARPWTDVYPYPDQFAVQGWYQAYPEDENASTHLS